MDMIKIEGLTKSYKDVTAVDNLSLSVEKGELFALLGVNGAGKTTTIKTLCCLCPADSGKAEIGGYDVFGQSSEVKRIIGVSPQETAVAPNLTVRENLELIAGICGHGRKEAARQAGEMITELRLGEVEKKRAGKLSGGWQRRLSIAMALVTEPEILFLDEPTLGLDVIARRQLWDTIRSLKGRMTIVLTTHYLEEAEALCERIGIMADGRLRALGTAEELKEKAGQTDFEEAFIRLAGRGGMNHEN